MCLNGTKASDPAPHMRSITLAAIMGLALTSCDSGIDVEDLDYSARHAALIEATKDYYDMATADVRGKSANDSLETKKMLHGMRKAYPPDWTLATVWSDGNGGFHVATILGSDKPNTSFSHSEIGVIRSVIADTDSEGKVVDARIVEFFSLSPLQHKDLQHYAKGWLASDFGGNKIVTSEYDLRYAQKEAFVHSPDTSYKHLVPVRLDRVSRPGKIQADEWICYVSRLDLVFYCRYDPDRNVYYDCEIDSYEVEMTCYLEEDDDNGDDDSGGGDDDDGDDDSGGGSGRHFVDCDSNPCIVRRRRMARSDFARRRRRRRRRRILPLSYVSKLSETRGQCPL